MALIQSFEDLECWKEARIGANRIYDILETCRDFGFRDQIQRAAVSVMNNIAEGFARFSTKDRIQFLNISVSSLSEVRSMIYLGSDRKYFSPEQAQECLTHNEKNQKLVYGLLKHLHSYKNNSFNQSNGSN